MPSRGTQSLRKYGCQRTSTGISGTSASAFSRRRLPMKHHGQTTSETTSIGITDEGEGLMIGFRLLAAKVGGEPAYRNRSGGGCASWSLIAKRADHEGVCPLLGELVANRAAVAADPGKAMAGKRVG